MRWTRTLERLARVAFAALVVLFGISSARVAQAQTTKPDKATLDEAKDHFKRGMQLFQEGSLDGAIAELQRAYDLSPNWKILYNIGAIYRDQRNYVESIKAYEKFLADGGKNVEPAKVREVTQELVQLRKFVGRIEVATNIEGADIRVDDTTVGTSPLRGPIPVNAGKHRVSASAPGRRDAVDTITIAGGDLRKIELNLGESSEIVQRGALPSPSNPPPPSPSRVVPIVLLGTGGAALVTAGVFGILTLSARSDAKAGCKDAPSGHLCGAEAQSDLDREKTFGIVTDIALVSGIALVGVGTFMLLRSSGDGTPRAASSGVSVTGRVRAGGFELAGTF